MPYACMRDLPPFCLTDMFAHMQSITQTRWHVLISTLLAGAALSLSAVLWQVYPYGIVQPDSIRYLRQGMEFQWNVLHAFDAWNPPFFSFLLAFSARFSEPSLAIYWIHSALFALSMVIAYRFAALVLGSRTWGFVAGVTLLITEAVLFRVLFYNVELLSDPLYIHCVFIGTLFVIVGLLQRRRTALWTGFFLLGCASLIRNIGVIFVLCWTPVLLVLLGRAICHRSGRKVYATLLVAIALLVLPTGAWYARTALLSTNAYGNQQKDAHLLWRLSYIFSAHDIINPMRATREGIYTDVAPDPQKDPEAYAIHRYIIDNLDTVQKGVYETKAGDAVNLRIGLWALHTYFGEYLYLVLQDYMAFFSVREIARREYIEYKENPNTHYEKMHAKQLDALGMKTIYPQGMPVPVAYNRQTSAFLWGLCCDNSAIRFMRSVDRVGVIAVHTLLTAAFIGAWLFGRRKDKTENRVMQGTVSVAILLATACLHALATVMITTPGEIRLSLPGSLPIHFALILAVLLLLKTMHGRPKAPAHRPRFSWLRE